MVEPDRPQTKIRHVRLVRCITKATNTHSEYVILFSFPPQQRLHGRASVLCYTHYTACLVTTETESVYCAVRTWSLYIIRTSFRVQRLISHPCNAGSCYEGDATCGTSSFYNGQSSSWNGRREGERSEFQSRVP